MYGLVTAGEILIRQDTSNCRPAMLSFGSSGDSNVFLVYEFLFAFTSLYFISISVIYNPVIS